MEFLFLILVIVLALLLLVVLWQSVTNNQLRDERDMLRTQAMWAMSEQRRNDGGLGCGTIFGAFALLVMIALLVVQMAPS